METEKEDEVVQAEEMDVEHGKEGGESVEHGKEGGESVEHGREGDESGVKERTIRKALPKAVLRRRNNSRIKKMAMPKAPLQVLNELVGPSNVACNIVPSSVVYNGIRPVTAQIVVGGETFTGCGPNKNVAKNIAAEAAVHKIAMTRFQEKTDPDTNDWRFQETVPWGALASMALFKLFNDWQSNGYSVPAQLCSQELDMKGMSGDGLSGMGGSMSGIGGGMSGVSGIGGGMSGIGGPQMMMGSNLDFTDESGAFHAFQGQSPVFAAALANKTGPVGPSMGQRMPMMRPGMSMNGSGMPMNGSGMPMNGSGMPMNGSGMPMMGPGSMVSAEKHPVSLLMEKHGKEEVTFEGSEEGEIQNKVYISVCKVNGQTFSGKAKSKKEAKRQAAIEAVAGLML